MSRRGLLIGSLVALLVFLVGFSVYLAITRIYQVDECQNLYMAMVLATGKAADFFTNGALFLLGPLSWISRGCDSSQSIFTWGRILSVGIFWLNLLLLAAIASRRLWSTTGLIALAAVATLAPLWDYGFEVRHDNLILTCVLLIWWAARVRPMGLRSYIIAGAFSITALFLAVKSVVYVLPLSFAILAFPPPGHNRPRWQLALGWVGGACLAALIIRLCYGTGGMWQVYLAVFRGVTKYSAGPAHNDHTWPWFALSRLFRQTPLLLALTAAACFAAASDLWRRGKAALSWEKNLPELLLLAGALGALMINPTPFPYNLLHFVPYAFLLVFRYASELWEQVIQFQGVQPFALAIFIFGHLVPFGLATERNLDFPNDRQRTLMRLAEDFTDAKTDAVYDAIGMVPTRRSIHPQWYLHSLNIRDFTTGTGPRVRDMLAARPAAVLIPNYRTDGLTDEDHAFIRKRYLPLADDFWVLGSVLPAAGGTFEIVHPGRYQIVSVPTSGLSAAGGRDPEPEIRFEKESVPATLDGVPLPAQVVELALGTHRIETSPDRRAAIIWLGPRLERLPQLNESRHRDLFVNWF